MQAEKNSWEHLTTKNRNTERLQALADILRLALCCHMNETCVPIANPPNSAQLGGTLPFSQVTSSLCSSLGMRWQTEMYRYTDSQDQYTFRFGYASREL